MARRLAFSVLLVALAAGVGTYSWTMQSPLTVMCFLALTATARHCQVNQPDPVSTAATVSVQRRRSAAQWFSFELHCSTKLRRHVLLHSIVTCCDHSSRFAGCAAIGMQQYFL